MPDVNYESDFSLRSNKSAQQEEIEKLKKEVYLDGLQVEEEGLTDMLRKKIKQTSSHDDSSKSHHHNNNNEKNLNEALIVRKEIIFKFSNAPHSLLYRSLSTQGRPSNFISSQFSSTS